MSQHILPPTNSTYDNTEVGGHFNLRVPFMFLDTQPNAVPISQDHLPSDWSRSMATIGDFSHGEPSIFVVPSITIPTLVDLTEPTKTSSSSNNLTCDTPISSLLNNAEGDIGLNQSTNHGGVCVFDPDQKGELNGPKKRGRPRKHPIEPTRRLAYSITCDPTYAIQALGNDSDIYWCPHCCLMRQSNGCEQHPFSCQPDTVVDSFARLSKPPSLRIEQGGNYSKVVVVKKLPALTRFGPLVGPTVSQDELHANPDWLPECKFPVEINQNGNCVTKYFHLTDENQCNWMMFARLLVITEDSPGHVLPNTVAYQQGDHVYFLTTRSIYAGEELVVTYSPPYASRFGLPHSLIALDHRSAVASNQTQLLEKKVPDEIHCFHCCITFHSEDAFRIHCLGHSGELERRGMNLPEGQPDNDLNSVNGLPTDNHPKEVPSDSVKPTRWRSGFVCSVCSTEFDGLPDLIRHTDAQHSVLRPSIFRRKSFSALVKLLSAPVGFDAVEAADDTNYIRLDDPPQNDMDLSFTELQRISSPLLHAPLYAFGCGICREQFGTMHLLEQHKLSSHSTPSHLESDEPVRSVAKHHNDSTTITLTAAHPKQQTSHESLEFSCDICARQFRTRSAFTVHMRSHQCETAASCCPDPERPTSETDGRPSLRPRASLATKRFFFYCGVCGEGQRNQKALQSHQVKHQRKSDLLFPCPLCPQALDRAYQTFAQLQHHIRFVHPKTLFPCVYCSRTFGRRHQLEFHMAKHTGKRDFVCSVCSKAYSRKDKLKDHMKIHRINEAVSVS